MADIELVIKIPQDAYELMRKRNDLTIAERVIANGKPLKKGHWIVDIKDMDYCFCSECQHRFDVDHLKFSWDKYELPPHCPNCGADMRGDRNAGIN